MVPVFATTSARGELRVRLPTEWARQCRDLTVDFYETGTNGWHLRLLSDGEDVMCFPCADNVDQILVHNARPHLLPARCPVEKWSDLDEGWWAVVLRIQDEVYLAQADLDSSLDNVTMVPQLRLVRPGLVQVDGCEVTWHRSSLAMYEAAWAKAVEAAAQLSPDPIE